LRNNSDHFIPWVKIRRMAFYTAAFSVAGVFDACSQYE